MLSDRAYDDSGQKLTCAVAGTCPTALTVEDGATYFVTAQDGLIHLGHADCDSDDTLILWSVPAGTTRRIKTRGTTLYYFSDTAGVVGRLARAYD